MPAAQTLPPAPQLPSVLAGVPAEPTEPDRTPDPPPAEPASVEPANVEPANVEPTRTEPTRTEPTSEVELSRVVSAHRRRAAELYHEHQRRQAEIFHASLRARHRMLAGLLQAARAAAQPEPVTGTPAPPRPPDHPADPPPTVDTVPLGGRVLAIEAATTPGTGTIRTELEVPLASWQLDSTGRMTAGLLTDAGTAHALLAGRLAGNLTTTGGWHYRLLSYELTYHGSPPRSGETLHTEVRLSRSPDQPGEPAADQPRFTFSQQTRAGSQLLLSIHNGQSRIASDDRPGQHTSPTGQLPATPSTLPPAAASTNARGFGPNAVRAAAGGRPADCFGPGWLATRAHVRTPRINAEPLLLLDEVTAFDPEGGPHHRGYLRAETTFTTPGGPAGNGPPDSGSSDAPSGALFSVAENPGVPGSLLWQGCLQAMAFYLTALGCTIERDGWRFEPLPEHPVALHFGTRVRPGQRLRYEVLVTGVAAGPEPALTADILCTVDGVPALQVHDAALRLVPDWPLEHWRLLGPPAVQVTGDPVPLHALGGLVGHQDEPAGTVVHGYRQLLASAWGRPSEVAGQVPAVIDETRRVCRLPGPPYLFITRIVAVDAPPGDPRIGTRAVAEYDVPDRAWFFEQNDCPTMPMAVLMEVVLQPCGWLAGYLGRIRDVGLDLRFRNLDGSGTVLGEVRPDTRCLRTEVALRHVAEQGDVTVEWFGIRCLADGVPVFELTAVFGFFPPEAFDQQVGMPPSAQERAEHEQPGNYLRELRFAAGPAAGPDPGRLAGPMLLMLDRITGYWPDGGRAGLGRLRAEKDVDAGEWFFKCHFFQDPVWPGSLGIEAMCQLLRCHLIERGALAGLPAPRFEPVMLGRELTWRYRGQVVPTDGRVTVTVEITEYGEDERGRYAVGDAWLWVDGRRIYHATSLGVRVGPAAPADPAPVDPSPAVVDTLLDPAPGSWVHDHCPAWTVATLPMMSIVDILASAAARYTGQDVRGVYDVQLRRWLAVEGPVRLRTEVEPAPGGLRVRLLTAPHSPASSGDDPPPPAFELVATGTVQVGTGLPQERPAPFPPLAGAEPAADPYACGAMFHGPAFQYLTARWIGPTGCVGLLDAGRGRVPRGQLHQGLLDAALHAIPHQDFARWAPDVAPGWAGVPHQVHSLELFEPLPDQGPVTTEARFAGFVEHNPLLVKIDVQLQVAGRVAAAMRVVEILLPLLHFGKLSLTDRRAFLRDRSYVDGCGLSQTVDGTTVLSYDSVAAADRLPNRVAPLYGLPAGSRARGQEAVIAAKDHLARRYQVHPSAVEVSSELDSARVVGRPETRHGIHVEQDTHEVRVRSVTGAQPATAPSSRSAPVRSRGPHRTDRRSA